MINVVELLNETSQVNEAGKTSPQPNFINIGAKYHIITDFATFDIEVTDIQIIFSASRPEAYIEFSQSKDGKFVKRTVQTPADFIKNWWPK